MVRSDARLALTIVLAISGLVGISEPVTAQTAASSQLVSWSCTGSPCPWGSSVTGEALVWPAEAGALNARLGYSVSAGIYLPAAGANGTIVALESGSATVYAGLPDGTSHRVIGWVEPGQPLEISGVAAGEVVSVQSGSPFVHSVILADVDPEPSEPTVPDPPEPTPSGEAQASTLATWSCVGIPCPWGPSLAGHAVAWPPATHPVASRLGYTVSAGVYLPAATANTVVVTLASGSAIVVAGFPDAATHRLLAVLSPQEPFHVSGLAPGEVLSIQADYAFGVTLNYDAPTEPEPTEPEPTDPEPGEPTEPEPTDPVESSVLSTWTCTGSPCPWGSPISGHAAVWPTTSAPLAGRLGYSVSGGVYLPAAAANGMTVTIVSGSAIVTAGAPGAHSHAVMASLTAGQSLEVAGLEPGQVVSVQSETQFAYTANPSPVDEFPTEPSDPSDPPDPGPSGPPQPSSLATWTCTGLPCPWGTPLTGHIIEWPAELEPLNERLGYTVSQGAYLEAARANGRTIALASGSAIVTAGFPGSLSHRVLAAISAGESYSVGALTAGEVLSVQSDAPFAYYVTDQDPETPDPEVPDAIHSTQAWWRCNIDGCTEGDWLGAVLTWPEWAAYENNNRSGTNSRTVYDSDGTLLYPYMGAWANGCQVTAVSGVTLIIEWQRGTDQWREIVLDQPGQSHTITLTSPEDGAMIETLDGHTGFSVQLANCEPQPVPR